MSADLSLIRSAGGFRGGGSENEEDSELSASVRSCVDSSSRNSAFGEGRLFSALSGCYSFLSGRLLSDFSVSSFFAAPCRRRRSEACLDSGFRCRLPPRHPDSVSRTVPCGSSIFCHDVSADKILFDHLAAVAFFPGKVLSEENCAFAFFCGRTRPRRHPGKCRRSPGGVLI